MNSNAHFNSFKPCFNLSLYVITAEVPELKRSHLDVAKEAIEGGATLIQLREKGKSTREILEIAYGIKKISDVKNIPLIINDHLDIALAASASGVHLGRDDLALGVARNILGDKAIIGASAGDLEEALEAEKEGADYLGVGPVFPTPSKDDAAEPIGIEGLRKISEAVSIPVVAIGGISEKNVESVLKAGADGVATISAVSSACDMKQATSELFTRIKEIKGRPR